MQEPAAPLKLTYFFAGEEFRDGIALTAGGVYLNLEGEDKFFFKRRLTPLQALELARGSTVVCARLSAAGREADYADSLEIVSLAPGSNLLFEFACRCVEQVFQRQSRAGHFYPAAASTLAVAARRLWMADRLSGAELNYVHQQALAVLEPYNGAMPGTPWWSFYNADAKSICVLAECAAALVASSFKSNANFKQEVITAVEKRVCHVSRLSVYAAAANGRAQAWRCRAEQIGSPPASYWNDGMDYGLTEGQIISEYVRRVDKGDIWKQVEALAQEAAEEMEMAQNKILAELLSALFGQ